MEGILSDRAVLRIVGEDTQPFLQGLVTQDVASLDRAMFAALLTPQGKILFDFLLVPAPGGFFIDCCADAAPALLKRFSMYKLRAKVAISEERDLAVAVGGGGAALADPRHEGLPSRVVVKRENAPVVNDEYDDARLALGVSEFGKDFGSDEVFLLDVNFDALNAVNYKKGCFVGQEVTSRMKRKGEIRKRTLIARFEGSAPAKGADVVAGENSIGQILSGRDGVALALVRLDRLKAAEQEGRLLTADGCALQISFPDYLERV